MSTFDYFCREYAAYQSFISVNAMKDSLRLFRRQRSVVLSDACQNLLRFLERMSTHVVGVSWMNAKTIADKIKISTRQVTRCLDILIAEGVLEKHRRTHKKGGRRFLLILKPFDPEQTQPRTMKHQESSQGDSVLGNNVALNVELNVRLVEGKNGVENADAARDSAVSDMPGNIVSSNYGVNNLKDKTNVSKPALTNLSSQIVDNFLKTGIPQFFQSIASGLRPDEMVKAWDRAQKCSKATRSKFVLTDLIEKAWRVTRDKMKRSAIESGDFIGFFYGTLRNLYENFEIHLLRNTPELHSEYFYEVNSRSSRRFRHSKPFITKAKEKFVRLIMNRNSITYEEAAERYFAGE